MKEIIEKVRTELETVDDVEGLCFYAANNLKHDLEALDIFVNIYNIRDLIDIDYDHYFVLATDNDDYLIDLTYKQFDFKNNQELRFFNEWPGNILLYKNKSLYDKLIKEGYSKITDSDFYDYLQSFDESFEPFFTIDDITR